MTNTRPGMAGGLAAPSTQLHVLILPSERYQPPENHLLGIFQRHQAEALTGAGLKVGVLAPPDLQSLRLLGRAPASTGRRVTEESGVAVMRLGGWSWVPGLLPGSLATWRWRWRRGFDAYCRSFGRPDVLHAHSARVAGVVAREISERSGVPYVLTEHDSAYGRGRIEPAEARRLRAVFAGARCRLVVSPSLGGLLERVIGPSAVPWRHVPNLLDGLFERGGAGAPGPGKGRRVLFSAGSLDSKKGFDVLLRAYARAFPESEGPELRIAGSGPEGAGLQKLAADLGVAERVKWLGLLGRDAMLQEMRTATCFVLASRTETFGVVVIEALACGRPVVVTASGGPESIVVPGDGFVVPVEDVEALAAAMRDALQLPAAWDAEAIRRRCLERYGEAAVRDQLIGIYREALA